MKVGVAEIWSANRFGQAWDMDRVISLRFSLCPFCAHGESGRENPFRLSLFGLFYLRCLADKLYEAEVFFADSYLHVAAG